MVDFMQVLSNPCLESRCNPNAYTKCQTNSSKAPERCKYGNKKDRLLDFNRGHRIRDSGWGLHRPDARTNRTDHWSICVGYFYASRLSRLSSDNSRRVEIARWHRA